MGHERSPPSGPAADQSEAMCLSTFTSVTKIDYKNIRSERYIKDHCSRCEILTFLRNIQHHSVINSSSKDHSIHQPSSHQLQQTQHNTSNLNPSTMSSTTTGAVPVTCCGRDGGCICAKEAKCSCGKQPAMQCNCEKSTTENKTSGAGCSCSKSNHSKSTQHTTRPKH